MHMTTRTPFISTKTTGITTKNTLITTAACETTASHTSLLRDSTTCSSMISKCHKFEQLQLHVHYS